MSTSTGLKDLAVRYGENATVESRAVSRICSQTRAPGAAAILRICMSPRVVGGESQLLIRSTRTLYPSVNC